MSKSISLAVVIPALNEAKSIASVINAIHANHFDAIVVDDGSSDDTSQIAGNLGAILIRHDAPKGYEAALSSGIRLACERAYDYVATFDADGQFDIRDLVFFSALLNKQSFDLLVGVRDIFNRKSERLVSRLGKSALNLLDPLCGLKLYRTDVIKPFLPFDRYKLAGTELAIKLILSGASFHQHPIRISKRTSPSRYGASIKGEWKIFIVFIKQLFFIFLWKRKQLPSFKHA